jgi:peptidoglycan/LPS O-acetylase OafA/YrhL
VILAGAFTLGCFAVGEPHMIRFKVAVACVSTVFTICLARDVNAWRQAIAHPALLFLGRISYSFYLLHATIGWRVAAIIGIGATQIGIPAWLAAASCFAGSLAASILVAWITYRLVERPSIALSHRISLPTAIDDHRPGRKPQPMSVEPS